MRWQNRRNANDGAGSRLLGRTAAIHRHVDYPPDVWLLSAHGIAGFTDAELKSKTLEEAKDEAEEILRDMLESALREVNE